MRGLSRASRFALTRVKDSTPNDVVLRAAAAWLARRDRGLSAAEQDSYLQWLREDPAHGRELARLESSWNRLDALIDWQPVYSLSPNPDLLAPPRRRTWAWTALVGVAAAVALAIVFERPALAPAPRAAMLPPNPVGRRVIDRAQSRREGRRPFRRGPAQRHARPWRSSLYRRQGSGATVRGHRE